MVRYEIQRDKAVIFIDSPKHGTKEVYVNVEHLAKILRFSKSWRVLTTHGNAIYAVAAYKDESGKPSIMLMHHLVLSPEEGMETDHVNRNGLDNRKRNLRSVTHAQNMQNRTKQKNNHSGYRNVHWCAGQMKWKVEITKDGKRVQRYFSHKAEAAMFAENLRAEVFPCSEPVKYSV